MQIVKSIEKLNKKESILNVSSETSWHSQYKDSAYIFVGGLHNDLNEGDVIAVFSQYGEVRDLHMPRDKGTGLHKGFAFLQYADQRSTVLAVDNFNGIQLCKRTIRVDHVLNYQKNKYKKPGAEESSNTSEEEEKLKMKEEKKQRKEQKKLYKQQKKERKSRKEEEFRGMTKEEKQKAIKAKKEREKNDAVLLKEKLNEIQFRLSGAQDSLDEAIAKSDAKNGEYYLLKLKHYKKLEKKTIQQIDFLTMIEESKELAKTLEVSDESPRREIEASPEFQRYKSRSRSPSRSRNRSRSRSRSRSQKRNSRNRIHSSRNENGNSSQQRRRRRRRSCSSGSGNLIVSRKRRSRTRSSSGDQSDKSRSHDRNRRSQSREINDKKNRDSRSPIRRKHRDRKRSRSPRYKR